MNKDIAVTLLTETITKDILRPYDAKRYAEAMGLDANSINTPEGILTCLLYAAPKLTTEIRDADEEPDRQWDASSIYEELTEPLFYATDLYNYACRLLLAGIKPLDTPKKKD